MQESWASLPTNAYRSDVKATYHILKNGQELTALRSWCKVVHKYEVAQFIVTAKPITSVPYLYIQSMFSTGHARLGPSLLLYELGSIEEKPWPVCILRSR